MVVVIVVVDAVVSNLYEGIDNNTVLYFLCESTGVMQSASRAISLLFMPASL